MDGGMPKQRRDQDKRGKRATLGDAEVPPDVLRRMDAVRPMIERTQRALRSGGPSPDTPERKMRFIEREAKKNAQEIAQELAKTGNLKEVIEASQERVIRGQSDILSLRFLAEGLHASRAIGRITFENGMGPGTGFLVSPLLFLTNNHVLREPRDTGPACVEFEEFGELGHLTAISTCKFAPDRFFFTSKELDVTIVALEDSPDVRAITEPLGWHPMIGGEGKICIGHPVNIIQHPGGRAKSIVVHDSRLMHLENATDLSLFCWYTSDTERGSSGSPVFNNRWEVIAVHHRSVPKTNRAGEILGHDNRPMTVEAYRRSPDSAQYWANEGTRTSRIVAGLRDWKPDREPFGALRDELLKLWESAENRNVGQEAARRGVRAAPAGDAPGAPLPGLENMEARFDASRQGPITIHIHLNRG